MKIKLLPHQRKLIQSTASRRLLIAGVGAGKTLSLCILIMIAALRQERVRGGLLAPTYRLFLRVVLPTWMEVVPPDVYEWKPGIQRIEMCNGTHIDCMGTDKVRKRLVGFNWSFAGMDEAGVAFDDDVAIMAMQRVRFGDPRERFLAMASSPHGHGWLEQWGEKRDKYGRKIAEVINATTYDNPFLPQEYIDDLELDFPPGTLEHEQEMLGRFISLTGLMYGEYFDRPRNISVLGYDPTAPYVLGVDPGKRASGWVALQERAPGRWLVVREWLGTGPTEDIAESALRDMGRAPRAAYLDTPSKLSTRTGITDVQALRQVFGRGTTVRVLGGVKRSSKYRHKAVAAALSRGELEISSSLIPRRPRPAERGLVHALETMPWKDVSTRDESTDEKDPRKHILDALEFAVAILIPPRNYTSEDRADTLRERAA